ncbi:MAG: HEAT repeat domain-containing protein [Candidatus Aminicenantales bacterium]
MKCENARGKFPDFLSGDLKSETRGEFDAHIASCAACGEELRGLGEIWTKLGVLPQEQPSIAVRDKFYTMLEAYKDGLEAKKGKVPSKPGFPFSLGRIWRLRPAFPIAAAAVLIIVGLAGGFVLSGSGARFAKLQKDVDDMHRITAVSLLQQPSPSERLRGLSYTSLLKEPGKTTLDALLQTLDGDPNINVRLAAVDALYLFSSKPEVKDGVLRSLSRQESPIVQSALIDLLVDIRERRAVDALKALIGSEKLRPEIKKKAELGIQQLGF